jgi:hypothetical protein
VISSTKCSFPKYGNSVVGTTTIVVGVHMNTQVRGSGGKNVIFLNGPNSTSECSKLLY